MRPSEDSGECGYSGSGESCDDGTTATWDFISESICDELWSRWSSNYYVAGEVCIAKLDHDNIQITYTTSGSWSFKELNVWIGCDQDGYPQYTGTYDNYPKISEFDMQSGYLSSGTQYYQFTTSISSLDGCDSSSLSYCDYCSTPNELLFYAIAHARVRYTYSSGYTVYKTAFMEGDWVFYYGQYWALQHQLLADADCC